MPARDFGDRGYIDESAARIGEAFDEDRFGTFVDMRIEAFGFR